MNGQWIVENGKSTLAQIIALLADTRQVITIPVQDVKITNNQRKIAPNLRRNSPRKMISRALVGFLLVISVHGFSPNTSLRQTVTLQRPSAAFRSGGASSSPLSGTQSDGTFHRNEAFETAKRQNGKRRGIRSLISRRGSVLVPPKGRKRRALATFAFALAVWVRGAPSLPNSSFRDVTVAHAAGPIVIKFNGAEMNAHGTEWQSTTNGEISNVLIPVTLPIPQDQVDKVTRRSSLVKADKGKVVAVAAGAFLLLVPVAKKFLGGAKASGCENDENNDIASDSSAAELTQENLEVSILHEDDDDAESKVVKDFQQQTRTAKLVKEAIKVEESLLDDTKGKRGDTKSFQADLGVPTLSEESEDSTASGEGDDTGRETDELKLEPADDTLSTTPDEEKPLVTEVLFLSLSILAAAASVFFL